MSSPAAIVGAEAGCPFCIARLASFPAFGDSVLLLNGYKAGAKYTVLKTDRPCRHNEFIAAEEHGEGFGVRCSRDNELYLPLPSAPAPSFMPSFDLRRSFIIEDVVRSFCDAGLEGKKFIVTDSMMHHLIYVCWKK